MRAVAFTFIFFIYIFSISTWLVEVQFFAESDYVVKGLDGMPLDTHNLVMDGTEDIRGLADSTLNPERDGNILDRVGAFADTGFFSVWTMLELLSGTYAFNVLGTIGLPASFVLALKLIFPILVGFNVLYFLIGRY